MKLTHIFWSLLVLAALLFVPVLLCQAKSNLNGGPDLYAFFLLIWIIVSMSTPILITLRKCKLIHKELDFTFTLLFMLNLYFGVLVLFKLFIDQTLNSLHLAYFIFPLNLLWATIIFNDLVVRYRRRRLN